MTQNDPTDHALAAIASILDNKDKDTFALKDSDVEHGSVTVITETTVTETVAVMVSAKPDTTEHLTAEFETMELEIAEPDVTETETTVIEQASPSTVPEPIDVDGYSRAGPGPLDAIRFRWTVRRDEDGHYYVDETIGMQSRPITSGPMPKEDVIHFIDERADATQRRFEALKTEMTIAP